MPHQSKHLRFLLFSILLLSYVQGVFRGPLYEVLHLISHYQDDFGTDLDHRHHEHLGAHQHPFLDCLATTHSDVETDFITIKFKKVTQYFSPDITWLGKSPLKPQVIFSYLFPLQDITIPIFVPPPGLT